MIEPRDNSAKGVFGRLQVRLDPWQPEFGPEFAGFDEMAADGPESVDIELERPRDHWEPIDPELNWPLEHPVWFIDGVRRLEARVTAKLDGQYSYGAFGAYGVGAVQIDRDQACFERFGRAVRRRLTCGSKKRHPLAALSDTKSGTAGRASGTTRCTRQRPNACGLCMELHTGEPSRTFNAVVAGSSPARLTI